MSFPFQIFHTRKHARKLILIEQKSKHKIVKFLQNELLSSLCYQYLYIPMNYTVSFAIQRRLAMKSNQTGK